MAIRPFNSVQGYSVGSDPQITVIDAEGNVTATNLTVSGVSNLGPVGNVTITGGTNGQALVTDGSGVLSFQTIDAGGNRAAPMPYNILPGESYIVDENFQGLFAYPITIDGTLEVDGILIEVGVTIDSDPGQIFFDDNGNPTGNTGFTFDSVSGNFAVPGNSTFSGNVLPNANVTHNLGSPTQRWKDLYLSNNTIFLGESTISAATGNIILSSAGGAELEITGNANVTTIVNGNSNISVNANGNITTSVTGVANVMVVSDTGATVSGNIATTGIKTDNIYYANGAPYNFGGDPGGANTQLQFNNNETFGGSANLTFNSSTNVMTLGGNLTVGNVTGANLVSANYLVSNSGCVVLANGTISVSGNAAGIFNSTIDIINIGLAATTITIGSNVSNVTLRGNVIASNVISSGLVTAENITVGDLYSNRAPIAVNAANTVVDQFLSTQYRSAKYTVKASNDEGYQALEVLLVHDSINSIMTVYGSLSTTGNDIITLATTLESGNVKLLATGNAGNTVVNLMGTYVPD
jgi:hypothetical protein